MKIATLTYRIEPSSYAKVVLGRWLGRYWWIGALPVAIALGLAFWKVEFVIVALMIAMLIYPFALFMVYMNYALKEGARMVLLPHSVTFDGARLVESWDAADGDAFCKTPLSKTVAISDVKGVNVAKSLIAISCGDRVDDVVIIPLDAFAGGKTEMERFMEALLDSYRRNCLNLPL